MKKIICISAIMYLLMVFAVGCGGIEYCEVDGCPKEAFSDSGYCLEHKCDNLRCDNRATRSYGYCEECLERANN